MQALGGWHIQQELQAIQCLDSPQLLRSVEQLSPFKVAQWPNDP